MCTSMKTTTSHQGTRDHEEDEEDARGWRRVPEQFIVIFTHRISVFVCFIPKNT